MHTWGEYEKDAFYQGERCEEDDFEDSNSGGAN
jgi:hypothetical protein